MWAGQVTGPDVIAERETEPTMDTQLLLICFLTFVIHLIGTLAYSVRIAGDRKSVV